MQVALKNRCNALAWNPMEAYMFTVANEDYKLDSILLLCSVTNFMSTDYEE